MGGNPDYTKAQMTKELNAALVKYKKRRQSGDDMAEAGEELADTIAMLVMPRPCGMPREVVLRDRAADDLSALSVDFDAPVGEAIPLDDFED